MSKPLAVKNSVVVVTGGARGIGLAIAEAMRAQGARISIGDVDIALAQKEAARLGAFAHVLDVRSRESFAEFLRATEVALGPVDILINNAGIMPMGAFLDEALAISDAQIDINFRGVIHGMQLAMPGMLARRRGHIVNVASMAGRFAIPGAAVYCGTKHAVVGMTEAVAGEHRDSGVNFTMIMPSKVLTELSSGTDAANPGIPAVTPQEVAASVVNAIKKPRLHIAVPDYLQTAHAFYGLVPAWLQDRGRRVFGDTGILTKLDHAARGNYDKRLAVLSEKTKA
ncbi:MAG: SDR family oxidoreductase [Moraxellaceae bacterium]